MNVGLVLDLCLDIVWGRILQYFKANFYLLSGKFGFGVIYTVFAKFVFLNLHSLGFCFQTGFQNGLKWFPECRINWQNFRMLSG